MLSHSSEMTFANVSRPTGLQALEFAVTQSLQTTNLTHKTILMTSIRQTIYILDYCIIWCWKLPFRYVAKMAWLSVQTQLFECFMHFQVTVVVVNLTKLKAERVHLNGLSS